MDETTKNTGTRVYAVRTMLAATAAMAFAAYATPSEARSHHRAHRHHHHHHAWNDAQAAMPASQSFASTGRTFSGIASYYGNESGSRTASGQRMNPSAMTAAHRSLPFGTRVRVTHGERSVIVTINDRGPFIRGRVLDLSTGAARAIGLGGTGRVTAEILS